MGRVTGQQLYRSELSSVNRFVQWLTKNLKEESKLRDIKSWRGIPTMDIILDKLPACHLFVTRKGTIQHGFQNLYDNDLIVNIVIDVQQDTQLVGERIVHEYEEAIEDFVVRNQQPEIDGLIPTQFKVITAQYAEVTDGKASVDTLAMDLQFLYKREVRQD